MNVGTGGTEAAFAVDFPAETLECGQKLGPMGLVVHKTMTGMRFCVHDLMEAYMCTRLYTWNPLYTTASSQRRPGRS